MEHAIHNISPIYNSDSQILILGSFPSVKSREAQFFYHHPQNRFWKLLAALSHEDVPVTIADKKAFLFRNRIAIWDVIASCEIEGSSDSSIRNVIPNDISRILRDAPIRQIYTLPLSFMKNTVCLSPDKKRSGSLLPVLPMRHIPWND